MLQLGSVFLEHKIPFHHSAGEMQIYLCLKSSHSNLLQSLFDLLKDIQAWMDLNL